MRRIGLLALTGLLCPLAGYSATIFTIDTSCNPTIDTPASGGCTWYNFFESAATSQPSAGSSFQNYYVAAPDPPWTFTSTLGVTLRVLDGGHQGDTFDVFDNGSFIGTTSPTTIDANHSCANDPTGPGLDPAFCYNDPLMSRGTFQLASGSHSINIVWNQKVPGGDSTLQWFEVNTVPEPTAWLLTGAGLALAALRRSKAACRWRAR